MSQPVGRDGVSKKQCKAFDRERGVCVGGGDGSCYIEKDMAMSTETQKDLATVVSDCIELKIF